MTEIMVRTRGGFSAGYSIPRKDSPIPGIKIAKLRKIPNLGDKIPKLRKIPNPGDKNPEIKKNPKSRG